MARWIWPGYMGEVLMRGDVYVLVGKNGVIVGRRIRRDVCNLITSSYFFPGVIGSVFFLIICVTAAVAGTSVLYLPLPCSFFHKFE